jgi:L-rhamnose mutarotase
MTTKQKVIHLNPEKEINYLRKHDLTNEEICESPVFNGLTDEGIYMVKDTFIQMCHILLETFEKQDMELEFERNTPHISTGQIIELNPFKSKAA